MDSDAHSSPTHAHSSPTHAHSSTLVPSAHIHSLPPELIAAILGFLDVHNLRRAAAVSRLFYGSAWCSGLFLACSIVYHPIGNNKRLVALLTDVVQHALRNRQRLRLTLTFTTYGALKRSYLQRVLSEVSASVEVLVYLSVTIGPQLLPEFVTALRHPAPDLRELVILLDPLYVKCPFRLPSDLFCGTAPRLNQLVLHGIPLGPAPVPAFFNVSSVHLRCINQFPDINYAAHFPRLVRLRLAYRTNAGTAPPASFNFDGLCHLRTLMIDDFESRALMPSVLRSIDITKLAVLEHISPTLHSGDSLWPRDGGAVSIRITNHICEDADTSVVVVPGHRRWRRTFHVYSQRRGDIPPILALPGLLDVGQCVTYLRVDDEHFVPVLAANWPDLVALRALHIDCRKQGNSTPPGRVKTRTYLRCPALQTLTLFSCDIPTSIQSRKVAMIGRALAQSKRSAQERAVLVLVGVVIKSPVDHLLLQQSFSSIQEHAFSGNDSSWDSEDGLWDAEM